MHCDDARRQLDALHDGSLDAQTRDAVDAHLASCPDCQAAAADAARFDADLRRAFAPRRAATEAVANRVLLRVADSLRASEPTRGASRPPSVALAIAAAAAGFLLAVAIFRPWEHTMSRLPGGTSAEVPPGRRDIPDASPIQLAIATGA